MSESLKELAVTRITDMESEFNRWKPHLQELANNFLPRRARWLWRDFNRGNKINGSVVNNTPLLSARILSSGMSAAITSPQREWFRLTTPDPELADFPTVKAYLHQTQERLRWSFAISPFYRALADGVYPDIGVFGHHATIMEEDPNPGRILRFTTTAVGEAYLSCNEGDVVDTIGRKVPMTIRQAVRHFVLQPDGRMDWSKVSDTIKTLWDRGTYEQVVRFCSIIQPNEEMRPGKLGPAGMSWSALWWEEADSRPEQFSRIGGYDGFPGLCPRWAVTGGETYARSPAMDALGDSKQLQFEEKAKATLIDKARNPPMKASESMRGSRATLLPGDTTYIPKGQGEIYEPSHEIKQGVINETRQDIAEVADRIASAMHADLFLRLVMDERQQRGTATEIDELKNETALQLGPVLERLNIELLKPAVDRNFTIMDKRGFLPEPPPELDGVELRPEFISVMHEAQKRVGLGGIKVFVSEMGALVAATGRQDAVDKLNVDEIVKELGSVTGIKPSMILSDEEVKALRAQRADKQQKEAMGQAALGAAQGMSALAKAPAPSSENALGSVMESLSPLAGALGTANPLAAGGGLQ